MNDCCYLIASDLLVVEEDKNNDFIWLLHGGDLIQHYYITMANGSDSDVARATAATCAYIGQCQSSPMTIRTIVSPMATASSSYASTLRPRVSSHIISSAGS
jgi:hypothetical protein